MNSLWQTVLAIIGSVGGAGIIILGIVKLTSNMIAERLSKKYSLQLDKELESYKNELEKKNYVSKTRFDTEFKIYSILSEKVMDMVSKTFLLFPAYDSVPINETKEERKEFLQKRYSNTVNSYTDANYAIKSNAPFIPKEFHVAFSSIRDNCFKQMAYYVDFELNDDAEDTREALIYEYKECFLKTIKISDELNLLMDNLREYLSKLDVIGE